MSYIEADKIRKNLTALGLPVSFIKDEKILFTQDNETWFPIHGKIKSMNEFRKISEYRDIIEINRLWVEEKLKLLYNIPTKSDKRNFFYALLVALLTECKLSETLPDITPSEKWWLSIENTVSHSIPHELMGFIKSRDTRRILFHIIPIQLGISCNTFMAEMNLPFPERSSIVSPEWVKQYLKGDRHTQSWIYRTPIGKGLFLVLYTRRCQYSRCTGCNLNLLGCREKVHSNLIAHQVERAIGEELLESEKKEIKEIVISNNGSIFDPKTIPSASLLNFVSRASHSLPNLKKIIFETRIDPVTMVVLNQVKDMLEFDGKDIRLELAIGVEIFADDARNKNYRKGLRLEKLEEFAERLGKLGIKLRCYMMYKPLVGMTQQEADEDIAKAVDYFNRLSEKYKIDLTMHINPTYAAIDTPLAEAFEKGKYTPPDLRDLRRLLLSFEGSPIDIYVGLNDEGLAVPGGSFIKPGCEEDLDKLKKFNFTGDFEQLK